MVFYIVSVVWYFATIAISSCVALLNTFLKFGNRQHDYYKIRQHMQNSGSQGLLSNSSSSGSCSQVTTFTGSSNKSARSYVLPESAAKRTATASKVPQKLAVFREIHVVYRAFRVGDEIVGYAVWNSYLWRADIDQQFGFPANVYLRLEEIANETQHPPIIEAIEANAYTTSAYTTHLATHQPNSLAHLFLFNREERTRFRLGNNQPKGFHFVTKCGLGVIPLNKWIQHDDGDVAALGDDELSSEMEESNAGCQAFLGQMCAITQNPNTPGMHMDQPARFYMNKQRRMLSPDLLPLFNRVMNCAHGNISRPAAGDNEVQLDEGVV